MSVKRYTIYYNERERDMYVAESQDGKYCLHTDYAALLARHNALREAVEWLRECEEMHEDKCIMFLNTWWEFEAYSSLKAARAEVDRLVDEE